MKTLSLVPTSTYVDVAVPLPVTGVFTYSVPGEWVEKAQPGVRVRIPFKNREMIGYVVACQTREEPADPKIKPILTILDEEPVISETMFELTKWIADSYGASWGEAIENALPRWVKFGKRAGRALSRVAEESLPEPPLPKSQDFQLTSEQQSAFEEIMQLKKSGASLPVLLYGVTGSGKSEIYIRLIRETLKEKRSAICLVPEIALTEQLRRFFLQHFGSELEILHSKLPDSERFLAWKRLQQGSKHVVLGPRSAIFAPVTNLGLIVMDEEHESSYKQETAPRYHAREVALWRVRHEKALLVMGSATPSLEIMHRAELGTVKRIDLTQRIDKRAMPPVKIIDLKEYSGPRRRPPILTLPLVLEIETNLKNKEGTLLLLNRRGFSTHIHCPRCGMVETCASCHVSLTFHQEDNRLICHYCNGRKAVPERCSHCEADLLRFAGFGTEKVESEVARRFPTARIGRMDTDTIRKRGSHEAILREFRARKLDILIGTQMIAKGFDFPHVTLVGVILADVGLMLPDFRSSERTFQLLTQVAGRAGRGKMPGRVLIQTFSPEHPSIQFAKDHDYLRFYRYETNERYPLGYPPFRRLVNVIIRSKEERAAYLFGRALRERWDREVAPVREEAAGDCPEVMGPAPLPFYKLRGHYRWHVMAKVPTHSEWVSRLIKVLPDIRKPSRVAYAVDVDPLNIL